MFAGRKLNSLAAVLLLGLSIGANAQTDGTYAGYSPYSVFGVGLQHPAGTAWNRGMGGVGVAARSNRYVNTLNPASVTARDSLSFMSEFGVNGRASLFRDGDKRGANTVFNIDNFVISFPMWHNTAFMVGVAPISDVGYSVSTTAIDPYTGKQTFLSKGNGGMYQVYAAAGIKFWDRLCLGAQFNYQWGSINKKAGFSYEDTTHLPFSTGDSLQVYSFTGKLGAQYIQPLGGKSSLTLGATYQFGSKIRGSGVHFQALGSSDATPSTRTTLDDTGLKMGSELGIGLAYNLGDKFLAEVDYTRSDWSASGLDLVPGFSNAGVSVFAPGVGQSFRAGLAYTPNRSDIRYFLRRCTYRAGAYFEQSNYLVDGIHVNAMGVTLGMTLPVFRWYNGITVGLDFGQRGLAASQVKERYLGFSVGFNVFDIWFQKRPYE